MSGNLLIRVSDILGKLILPIFAAAASFRSGFQTSFGFRCGTNIREVTCSDKLSPSDSPAVRCS